MSTAPRRLRLVPHPRAAIRWLPPPALCVDLINGDRRRRYWIRPSKHSEEWFVQVFYGPLQHRGYTLPFMGAERAYGEFQREIAWSSGASSRSPPAARTGTAVFSPGCMSMAATSTSSSCAPAWRGTSSGTRKTRNSRPRSRRRGVSVGGCGNSRTPSRRGSSAAHLWGQRRRAPSTGLSTETCTAVCSTEHAAATTTARIAPKCSPREPMRNVQASDHTSPACETDDRRIRCASTATPSAF